MPLARRREGICERSYYSLRHDHDDALIFAAKMQNGVRLLAPRETPRKPFHDRGLVGDVRGRLVVPPQVLRTWGGRKPLHPVVEHLSSAARGASLAQGRPVLFEDICLHLFVKVTGVSRPMWIHNTRNVVPKSSEPEKAVWSKQFVRRVSLRQNANGSLAPLTHF